MALQLKGAVLFYPGCIEYEVMLALELLAAHSQLKLLTLGGAIYRGNNGLSYQPDGGFDLLASEALDWLLIPGGDAAALFVHFSEAHHKPELLPELSSGLHYQAEQGALIGAICAGPLLLAAAGLLHQRRYVHGLPYPEPEAVRHFFNGEFVDQDVVVDERLITALPQAHIAFACALYEKLGLCAERESERLKSYYQGLSTSL